MINCGEIILIKVPFVKGGMKYAEKNGPQVANTGKNAGKHAGFASVLTSAASGESYAAPRVADDLAEDV
jgi:hypothetical protein